MLNSSGPSPAGLREEGEDGSKMLRLVYMDKGAADLGRRAFNESGYS